MSGPLKSTYLLSQCISAFIFPSYFPDTNDKQANRIEPIHQNNPNDAPKDNDSHAPSNERQAHDNDERPRKKYDFNNNHGHHVIVKSYNNHFYNNNHARNQQDSAIEEEPEWFSEVLSIL